MNIAAKVVISAVVLFLFVGFWNLKIKNQNSPILNERVVQEFKSTLIINDGAKQTDYDINEYIGESILKATTRVLKGNVKVSGSGDKAIVVSLNGQVADPNKKQEWIFEVNGKTIESGVDVYKIQNHDTIIWKLLSKTN